MEEEVIRYRNKKGHFAKAKVSEFDPNNASPKWLEANQDTVNNALTSKYVQTSYDEGSSYADLPEYNQDYQENPQMADDTTEQVTTNGGKVKKVDGTATYQVITVQKPKVGFIQNMVMSAGEDLNLVFRIFKGDFSLVSTWLGRGYPIILILVLITAVLTMCGKSLDINPTRTAGEALGNGIKSGAQYSVQQIPQGVEPAQAQPVNPNVP